MNTKSIIVFGLATAIITSALVYDGVSHRSKTNGNPAASQNQMTDAAASTNTSNPGTDAQPATANDQSAAPATDSATATDAGQDGQAQDAQTQNGADASGDQPAADADASQDAAPQPIIVPAGTTLTVRLEEALGSRISEAGQKFSATLDQDVIVGGQTVIAAGARVTGKVLFARPAGALAGEANLQLKLTSVRVDNASLGLATSVRSFGPPIRGKNKVGKFMKGLVKRASGEEREVLLAEQSAYSFTLRGGLRIQ